MYNKILRHSVHNIVSSTQMELEVGTVEEVIDNVSDSDVDVDDSGAPPAAPTLSSAQLLMQATLAQPQPQPPPKHKPTPKPKQTKPKTPKINVTQPKTAPAQPKTNPAQTKTAAQKATAQVKPALMAQSAKQANLVAQAVKSNLIAQAAKQANVTTQPAKQVVKAMPKTVNVVKQVQKPSASPVNQPVKVPVKQNMHSPSAKPANPVVKQVTQVVQLPKSSPSVVPPPQNSPLIRQRPLQKIEGPQAPVSIVLVLRNLENFFLQKQMLRLE